MAGKVLALIAILMIGLMAQDSHGRSTEQIVVLITGNNAAQITDCGCGADPAGGLLRLASALDSLRQLYPEAILLDSGDWLSSYPNPAQDIQALRLIAKLHYDALAMGEYELPGFKPYLLASWRQLQLPLLASHLQLPTPVRKTLLFNRAGRHVRVMAFLEPELARRKHAAVALDTTTDMQRYLEKTIRHSALQEELIIAIFHQFSDIHQDVLQILPRNSLIVRGHWHRRFDPARDGFRQIAGRWVINPGDNGEYLAMAIFDLEKKRWSANFIRLNRAIPEHPELLRQIRLNGQQ